MEKDAEGFYTPKTADGNRVTLHATTMLIQFTGTAKPEVKESETTKPEVAEATRSGAHINVLSCTATWNPHQCRNIRSNIIYFRGYGG